MKKNSIAQEFNIKDLNKDIKMVTDYEIFPDKELLEQLRDEIITNLLNSDAKVDDLSREYINNIIDKTLEGNDLSNLERSHIFNLIDNELEGYGPLTELLKDTNITEIMVNSPNEIYIEIDGNLIKDENTSFINDEHIIRTIQRLIQPLGRTIDATNPMVDSRLPDGSRINAVIPPLSVKGPVMTVRKFKKTINNIDDLIRNGSMTPYMARFLEAVVVGKLNVLICGGTGSGKTSLLNVLSDFIPETERIVTIEDAAELKLINEHVIPLETRTVNYEKEGEVTIRDLVINALRMRPDRIIVGEVRGKEAFDMLQAMNTGHDGSITTLHANGPIDALNRLETMVLMSGIEIPLKAIREYIKNAIDIVVNIDRLNDGKRKVTSICEITGIENETIMLREIFKFTQKGITEKGEVNGEFSLSNTVPNVYLKLKSRGIKSIDDIFNPTKKQ